MRPGSPWPTSDSPPSLPAQVMFGAVMGGLMGPLVRFQERRGQRRQVLRRQHERQEQADAEEEPVPEVHARPAGRVRDDVREERHELDDADRAPAHLPRQGRVRPPPRDRAVARHDDHAVLHEEVRHSDRRGDALGAVARTEARHQDALQLGPAAVLGEGAIHRRHPRSQGRVRVELPVHQGRRLRLRDADGGHVVRPLPVAGSSRSADRGPSTPPVTGPSATGRTCSSCRSSR